MMHNTSIYKLITLLFTITISFSSVAETVTRDAAHKMAADFFNANPETRGPKASLSLAWDSRSLISTRSAADEYPSFYVFRSNDGNGFIIVSGENSTAPILGYSFNAPIGDFKSIPCGMKAWLESVDARVKDHRRRSVTADARVKALWTKAAVGEEIVLLETAIWNQGEPYNEQCPMDGASQCITGCVATATAIAMRYHQWPAKGKGATEAYTTKGINVPARNLEHEYKWDKMPLQYIRDKYDAYQADAVATLMADVGHAFKLDYGKNETSGSVDERALYIHFDYNPSLYYAYRSDYTDNDWKELIMSELMQDRPVIYRGAKENGSGHLYIVDGINTEGYMHVNWGWGGSYDGYYLIDDMREYNFAQGAVVNIFPNDGSKVEKWLKMNDPGIFLSEGSFEDGRKFTVRAYMSNNTSIDFEGHLRLALVDKNGQHKEWVSNADEFKLDYNSRLDNTFYNCVITENIKVGDKLRLFYKASESDEWELVYPKTSSAQWELPVADEYTIEETTSLRFDKKTAVLTLKYKDGVKCTVLADDIPVTEGITVSKNSVEIDTESLPSKTFTVRLTKTYEVKDIKLNINHL